MVTPQKISHGIIRHVNIRPAVIIKVDPGHAQAVSAAGIPNSDIGADFAKFSATFVVIHVVWQSRQTLRPARNGNALIATVCARARPNNFCAIEIHIARDIQIQATIAIVVSPGAAGVPVRRLQPGFTRNVSKSAVTIVVKQSVGAEIGDEDVAVTVVVVIADANSDAPSLIDEPRFPSYVCESSIAVVAKEAARGFGHVRIIEDLKRRAIHQKNIRQSIVVEVENSHPAA